MLGQSGLRAVVGSFYVVRPATLELVAGNVYVVRPTAFGLATRNVYLFVRLATLRAAARNFYLLFD